MKSLIPLALLVLWAFACSSEKEQTQFLIEGTITNAPEALPIYLRDVYTGEDVDSTTLEGNLFSFRGTVPFPTRYEIIYDGPFVSHNHTVWMENTQVVITADWEQMREASITAGKEQQLAMEVEDAMSRWNREHALPYYNRALYDLDDTAMMELMDYQESQRADYYLPLLIDRVNSYYGVEELYNRRDQLERDQVLALAKKLDDEIRTSPYGQSLLQYLEEDQLQEGDRFADFELVNLNNQPLHLNDLVGQGKPSILVFGALGKMQQYHRNLMGGFYYENKEEVEVIGYVWEHDLNHFQQDTLWYRGVPLYTDFKKQHSPMVIRYGVVHTPTVFVFDQKGILRYRNDRYNQEAHDIALSLLKGS
ncbi:MAG: DUF4369 domain-containing protein [Bacteroidota bacterium]